MTTTGRHKSNRQNLQQVSRPTNTIGAEAINIVEAVEVNVDATEVPFSKIEEDPNPENIPTAEIVPKAETDQHQGTETRVPVTGAAHHIKEHVWRLTKVSQLPENGTLRNKLQVTQSYGVGHEHVVSIDGAIDDRVHAQP